MICLPGWTPVALDSCFIVKVKTADEDAFVRFDGEGVRVGPLGRATRFAGREAALGAAEHARRRLPGTGGGDRETFLVEEPGPGSRGPARNGGTTDRILGVAGMILSAGVAAGCALFAVAFGVPALPFREELQGCLLGAFVTCGLAGLGLSVAAGCAGRD